MPRHIDDDPCDADLSLIEVYDHDTERMVWVRDPMLNVPMDTDDVDEEDCDGCDGDGLHADDRCGDCGRRLGPRGGIWGLCEDCWADEDDEDTTDDDEELL